MKPFIIVKFNESVSINNVINPIKNLFNQALSIEGIEDIKIHTSNINLPNRHDIMIEMYLTKQGLTNFDNSYIHKKWKDEYGELIINKTIFDCEQ